MVVSTPMALTQQRCTAAARRAVLLRQGPLQAACRQASRRSSTRMRPRSSSPMHPAWQAAPRRLRPPTAPTLRSPSQGRCRCSGPCSPSLWRTMTRIWTRTPCRQSTRWACRLRTRSWMSCLGRRGRRKTKRHRIRRAGLAPSPKAGLRRMVCRPGRVLLLGRPPQLAVQQQQQQLQLVQVVHRRNLRAHLLGQA